MKLKCESTFGDYKCHVPTNIKDSKGRVVNVDKCLKEAIESLNDKGMKTIASCCGHGIINPSVIIEGLCDGSNLNTGENNCTICNVKRSYLIFDEHSEKYYGKIRLPNQNWKHNCWITEIKNAYRYKKKEAEDLSKMWDVKIVKANCA